MDSRTLCLGVLMLGSASGYEIKKQFEEGPFAHFHAAGFGSIYPALSALLKAGHVTCTLTPQEGRPDKKVYAITEAGREALRRALHKPPAGDIVRSEAVFMLFFAELLDPDHRRAVFEAYLGEHREHVARMTAETGCPCRSDGQRFVHGLGLAIYRAVIDYMDQYRDALLMREDAGESAPPDRPGGETATAEAAVQNG